MVSEVHIYSHKRNRGSRNMSWLDQIRLLILSVLCFTTISVILYMIYISNTKLVPFSTSVQLFKSLSNDCCNATSHYTLFDTYTSEPYSSDDFTTISTSETIDEVFSEVNQYDVNSKLCRNLGENLQLLVIVISAPSHESARLAIRQTWGHFATRRDVAVAFIVGSTPNEIYSKRVTEEVYLYGDIIRTEFVDVYEHLTYKTIFMLKWVMTYCSKAAFVLKVNDDMFINMSRLLTFISMQESDVRAIYGRLATKWKRQHYKEIIEYPTLLPNFVIGSAYLFPTILASDLYLAALNQSYLEFEDVFLTGLVANYLSIDRIHVSEFVNRRVVLTACNIKRAISVRVFNKMDQFDLWTKLFNNRTKCV